MPLRRWSNFVRMSATDGITSGPTPSMTTSAWPSSSDITPVTRSMISRCSGRAEHVDQAAALRAERARIASATRLKPSSSSRVGSRVSAMRVISAKQVVAHPRDGGELHPVGLLVQADPQPEVVRVAPAARARRARCWGRPGAAGRRRRWNGSNWPSTLPARKPSSRPTSAPVTREPTAWASPEGWPFFSASLSTTGARILAKPSALAWTQPAPVDDQRPGRSARPRPGR